MKKLLFSLFSIFILLVYPLQTRAAAPTIVGPDDRESITGQAVGPEQAVVVLEAVSKDGDFWQCSGSMVGRNTVLTAAHCIIDEEGNYAKQISVYAVGISKAQASTNRHSVLRPNTSETQGQESPSIADIIFDPSDRNITNINQQNSSLENLIIEQMEQTRWVYDEAGNRAYPFAKSKKLWVPDKYIRAVHNPSDENAIIDKYDYDYGIIVLDNYLGDMTRYLGLKIPTKEELTDADIVVIGRGGDKPDRTLWRSPGHINADDMILSQNIIYFNADVLPGNSGGPVFKQDDLTSIVALAVRDIGVPHVDEGYTPNFGLPIRKEIIDAVKRFNEFL